MSSWVGAPNGEKSHECGVMPFLLHASSISWPVGRGAGSRMFLPGPLWPANLLCALSGGTGEGTSATQVRSQLAPAALELGCKTAFSVWGLETTHSPSGARG